RTDAAKARHSSSSSKSTKNYRPHLFLDAQSAASETRLDAREENMVKRREFMGGALGALAFKVGGASVLLTPREAHAQGVPLRSLKPDEAATLEALGET